MFWLTGGSSAENEYVQTCTSRIKELERDSLRFVIPRVLQLRRRTESAVQTKPTATFWWRIRASIPLPLAPLQHFGVRISDLVHHTDNSSVDLRTVADFTGSSSTMVARKSEVKSGTDEKRLHASSDDLFTSAPSQHYQPSVRAVPDLSLIHI